MRVETCARPAPLEAFREAGAASRQQRSAALTVTTAEGDTVTLRLASFQEGAAYSAPGRLGAFRQAQQTVEVAVNGDLNRRELADLGRLLRLLGRSVRELNQGDTAGALKPLTRIPLLDTLAQVSFAYRQEAEYGAFGSLPPGA
jgi:hypothetical protein